jgi:prepilin-type N-terminal cleavage/methylation domain-containing protein
MVHPSKLLARTTGFTLIEVLVACALFGVLITVAATNFTAMRPAFDTRGAALLVAGDLNQARMAAIQEGRVYDYFPTTGGYQIRRDDGAGSREVVKTRVLSNEYPHVSFGHTGIGNDPYLTAIASSAPTGTITFDSNGTVRNPAGMFLEAGGSADRVQRAVTLSAAGRVRVWKYGDGGWQ